MTSELLTPDQLAERLHTGKNTLAQWRYHGTGPQYVKVGRKVHYRASDVEAWLDAQTRQHTGATQHA
jgi:excisionase family DNA binding protein